MILLLPAALAATITVGTDQPTLQAALDAATEDDTITLPAGDWPGCVTSSGTVTIEGNGPARTAIIGADCAENFVHTGGELSLTGVTLSNAGGRALKAEKATVNLLDITVVNSGKPGLTGGGMYLDQSETTITNARLTGNRAERGGGVHIEGGSLTALGVVMAENSAQFGGALSARSRAKIRLSICQFERNTAAEKGYGKGGAIYGFGGVTLEDSGSNFVQNSAAVYGGAILLERDGGALILESTTLSDNRIQEDALSESSGGAVFVDAITRVELTEARFSSNKAFLYGGAAYLGRLQQGAKITDSFFTDNVVASKRGGALAAMDGGEVVISGGAFSSNRAAEGGGAISLYNNSARLTDGVEITGNANSSTQDAFGGGVFAFSDRDHMLTLDRAVISGNTAALSGGGVYASGLAALRVVDSTISNNTASALEVTDRYFGGGINAHDIPSVALSNVELCGNAADDGASLYLVAVEQASVVRSTFADAEPEGAGVVSDGEMIWTANLAGCP